MALRGLFLLAAWAVLAGAQGAVAASSAVSMDVAPTTLEMKPGTVDIFYVANHGAAPVTVQIEGFDWSQSGNDDTLTPSQTLIASPPVATIAPGGRQLVRVMTPPAPDGREHDFRLVVSQLADPSPSASNEVRILLRFGVPVFSGDEAGTPSLDWSASAHGGALDLTVRNSGAHTVKLDALHVADASGHAVAAEDNGFVYVLPGNTRHFRYHAVAPGAALHVTARDLRSEKDVAADVVARP